MFFRKYERFIELEDIRQTLGPIQMQKLFVTAKEGMTTEMYYFDLKFICSSDFSTMTIFFMKFYNEI